ncbi:MAG: hypothetical protein IT221_06385 [Fluviicola sp.]|nr:hypothetical protein [Fluviicola sp.]
MKNYSAFILLLLVALSSCKREKAFWTSDWQVPLINDSLTLSNLVEDSILTMTSSSYELDFNKTVFELRLSDFVSIPDTTVYHSYALGLASFNVPAGASFVNDVQEHEIEMGDIQLKKIRIKEGGILLTVKNPIAAKMFFTVQIPGATKNGLLLSKSLETPAGTLANPYVTSTFVDLAGYDLDLRGENLNSYNKIQTKLQVMTDPTGPAVTVTNQDSLRFVADMNNIKLDYARGYFGNTFYSDTIVETIEALNAIQSGLLDFDAATLGLEIENGLKVAGKFNIISLKSTNAEGNTVTLNHPMIDNWTNLSAAVGTESNLSPSTTSLNFNGSNSNLEQLLENHGGTNEIAYQIQLNPWGNTSGGWDEVFDAHPLKVNLAANMPLNIGMSDLIVQDTFDFSLKQNTEKTHVKSGTIWLNCTNAFPLQGMLTLYLLDENNVTLGSITASDEVLSSEYGSVVNGIKQKSSSVQFVVPESLVSQLDYTKKMVVKLKLNTPDGNTGTSTKLPIPANAFFKFKLGAKFVLENRI